MLNIYPQSGVPASRILWPKHAGFSLLELMIGVAILAILASIALPSFQATIADSKIRTAAESVQNGLQKARMEAITLNANVAFTLAAGTDSAWSICIASCTTTPGEIRESRLASEGSKNVTRASLAANGAPARTVTFNPLGRIAPNLDGTPQLTLVNLTTAGSSNTLRVTIGRLDVPSNTHVGSSPRVCDPYATYGLSVC